MFAKAIQDMTKLGLKDNFRKRCRQVVLDTRGMGWGFHDMLQEIYEDAFE